MSILIPCSNQVIRVEKFRKYTFAKNCPSFLLLAVSAAFCIAPLLIHQTLMVSHDIKFHLFQSDQFYKSLSSGAFIPKWALEANNGYGSANFLFYSPFSYYVVAFFHTFIPSLIFSMIAAIWSSFFLSGLSMFLMVKKFSGKKTGLLCAILYQVFPFHVIDLYLRGTLGELFGFIWFPLIFTYLNEILAGKKKRAVFIGLSLSYAGLILTHLVSAFIVSVIICVYISIRAFNIYNRKNIFYLVSSVTLGFGLAAYFIIPIIFEMQFIRIDYASKYFFADYSKNFLFDINSIDSSFNKLNNTNDMTGILNIVLTLETLLFLIVTYSLYKLNIKVSNNRYLLFSVFMFIFSFFMSTPLSRWLWDLVPAMNTIQFPWRWITYIEVALIFLFARFMKETEGNGKHTETGKFRCAAYVLSSLVLISVFSIFTSTNELPESAIKPLLNPEKYGYDTKLPREYTPVWARDLARVLKLPPPDRVTVLSGDATAQPIYWHPEKRVINIEAHSPSVLRVATFYYPGWTAESNGIRKQVFIEKNSGTMLMDILPGKHVLTLKLIDTPLRKSSKYLSLLSIATLFIYCATPRTHHG